MVISAAAFADDPIKYERAASQKCAKSSPVLFRCNYDEAALILPVNYSESKYLSRV